MLEPDRQDFDRALAEELDATRRALETLAGDLCLDDVVATRHAVRLQQFDQFAQVIGEVAGVLRHRGPSDQALAAIRVDTLRLRLSALAGMRPADALD